MANKLSNRGTAFATADLGIDGLAVEFSPHHRNKIIKKWPLIHIHTRRIFAILVNWFLNRDYILKTIGLLNRYFHIIDSVAVVYPATQEYALKYAYKSHLSKVKWDPYLLGFIWQNRKIIFLFSIAATEREFVEPNNQENLKKFVDRVETLKEFLNASEKRFAGVLPGILLSRHFIDYSPELATEVDILVEAEKKITTLEKYEPKVPIIMLGGKGFMGKKLTENFFEKGREVYCIDKGDFLNKWPNHLRGKKVILLNVSRREALSQYIPFLWSELVVINEVYPEPTQEELSKLTEIGVRCYHIVGVKGRALPGFPYSYAGGIPCCISHFAPRTEIIIRKLT